MWHGVILHGLCYDTHMLTTALLVALVLGQTTVPVKIVDPARPSAGVTTTVAGAKRGLDVNAVGTVPVTGAFYPATQPVSAVALPLPTGAATEATLSAASAKLPAALGPQAAAASLSVAPASGATFPVSLVSPPVVTVEPPRYAQTSFGEARVAAPYTLLDLVNRYGIDARLLDTQVVAGGTVAAVTAESAVRLAVTAAATDAAKLRTHVYWRYQPGRGQRVLQTLYLSANAGASANQVVRWGYFDDEDGLFWQRTGGITSFCRRTSTSGVAVDNCAPVTLPGADLTKGSIYEIGFQWLGVGAVVGWWNGAEVVSLVNANTLSAPYMKTADLPLSWEIVNTGAAQAASLTVICANVTSQGGQAPPEYGFTAERTTPRSVGTTNVPLLSVRIAAAVNGVDNRMIVLPHYVEAGNATQPGWIGVYLNATLTGPVWAAVNAASGVEFDVTATAVSGGVLMGSCFLPSATSTCTIDLTHIFRDNARVMRRTAFTGTSDTLTVVARRTGNANADVRATMDWTEVP